MGRQFALFAAFMLLLIVIEFTPGCHGKALSGGNKHHEQSVSKNGDGNKSSGSPSGDGGSSGNGTQSSGSQTSDDSDECCAIGNLIDSTPESDETDEDDTDESDETDEDNCTEGCANGDLFESTDNSDITDVDKVDKELWSLARRMTDLVTKKQEAAKSLAAMKEKASKTASKVQPETLNRNTLVEKNDAEKGNDAPNVGRKEIELLMKKLIQKLETEAETQ